jgi:prepilin peptidase CpaA
MPVHTALDVSLLVLVTLAAVNDLASRRIPNRLLLLAWAVALPLQGALGAGALLDALAGGACGMLLFLPLYLLGGMAAGDVKLMATVGAFVGAAGALQIAVLAWCAGGVMALAMVIGRGHVRAVLANLRGLIGLLLMRTAGIPVASTAASTSSVGGMPYGLAIAAATMFLVWSRVS